MKRLLVILVPLFSLLIPISITAPANAEPISALIFTLPNLSSEVTIRQDGNPGDLFSPGKAQLNIKYNKIVPSFLSKLNVNQEWNDELENYISNGAPKYCEAIPLLNDNALYGITTKVLIDTDPNFESSIDDLVLFAMIDLQLDSKGRIVFSHVNTFQDITIMGSNSRKERNSFQPYVTINDGKIMIKETSLKFSQAGPLYLEVSTEFQQYADCPGVMDFINGYTINYQVKRQEIEISKQSQTITAANPGKVALNNKVTRIKVESSSGLPVLTRELNSKVCIANGDLVHLISVGNCSITASQAGDDTFESAKPVVINFEITKLPVNQTITCVKGKLTKKVTALNPKCPSGYSKKS